MKLGDAIRNKDYSLFKKSGNSFDNYYDTLSQELYPDGYNIEYEHHDAVEESNRVKCYAVREWLCTDTHVGLYLYLIDDEPVCLMYQSGRKSYPEWSFLSGEALQKTRDFFDEYKPKKEVVFDGIDENILELYLDEKLFDSNINDEQMGLSPLLKYVMLIDLYSRNDFEMTEEFRNMLKEAVEYHDKLLEYMKKENDQVAIDRFLRGSRELYNKAMELLK